MIVRDDVSKILIGGRKALLINPPIYDTQYWAYWAQPHGLLKVAKWLKEKQGYTHLRLIDCLATDEKRDVQFHKMRSVQRGNISKIMRAFGMPLAEFEKILTEHANGENFRPDEIWITSIMTYWWQSTRDVIRSIERVFGKPTPRILVGGIYPTLYPSHADRKLREGTNLKDEELIIVDGEIDPEAANSWTDLSLYNDSIYKTKPKYGIITGSRGCPFDCAYCAQLTLNHDNRKVRHRTPSDIAEEIAQKQKDFGINEFAFYEDNLLFNREDFLGRLDEIRKRNLKIGIYAPEGIEPRLVEYELMKEMRETGFQKIHLALETTDNDVAKSWNRRQATIEKFDQAIDTLQRVGFRVGSQDMNAFVIFGIPDEDLQSAINTAVYASSRVGSVVPMLFTPVPGSILYRKHEAYLHSRFHDDGNRWDLHDLNGKLLPFLEYNQRKYPGLQASDYLEIESLMMHLNASKVFSKRFDIDTSTSIGKTFKRTLSSAMA